MENDQYASPVLIRKNETIILQRVPLMENVFNESWLQNLLFENSTILPFSDLEPTFDGSLPIAREMGTGAGPVDLIYMNSKGYITLVETKLWRNPEARRSVVAQIIDYAKEIAEWSYEQFVEAIKRTSLYKNRSGDPLVKEFSDMEGGDFDQTIFIDRVTRNLQKGRFLLLIVGDGIKEGVERMAGFLQQTPHLGYSLALVELSIYRESPERKESFYIQPKILVRTKEITRAIVELKIPATYSDIKVTLPDERPEKSSRGRITKEEFLEELEKSSGDKSVEFAEWVLDRAENHRLSIDWKEAGPILKYNDPESGQLFSLGQLNKNGRLTATQALYNRFRRLGWPFDACLDYFDEVASLIPGASRKAFKARSGRKKEREQIVYGKNPGPGDYPPFEILSEKKEDWFNAISKLIDRIQAFSGDQE